MYEPAQYGCHCVQSSNLDQNLKIANIHLFRKIHVNNKTVLLVYIFLTTKNEMYKSYLKEKGNNPNLFSTSLKNSEKKS